MSLAPRAVLVHRRTELAEALARHGTRGQAAFFLASRGRDVTDLEAADERQSAALGRVAAAVPLEWRSGSVERADLSRFLFGPEDVVVVVGQDGLVANVAKYLDGQVVVGIDTDSGRNPGVLVPHQPKAAEALLRRAVASQAAASCEQRTMVRAVTDDGQELHALNEVYLGHHSHQSSRYEVRTPDGRHEVQSSSGIVVGTGTGASGWLASLALERQHPVELPGATQNRLAWFVREAWPSRATGAALTGGLLDDGWLVVDVLSDELVVFGDGLEDDRLLVARGQQVQLAVSPRRLHLLH